MLLWLSIACTEVPAPSSHPLDGGWVDAALMDPASFTASIAPHRSGWVSLHANDLSAAASAGGPPGQLAGLQQRELEEALSRLAGVAWERAYATWARQVGIPEGSAIPVVAALSSLDQGDPERAEAWLARYTGTALTPLVSELRAGGLSAASGQTALGACVAAHLSSRGSGEPLSGCRSPLLEEGSRRLYDPLIYRTRAHRLALERPASDALLFGGQWSVVPNAALPESWGIPAADEPDAVRDRIRGLDDLLAGWRAAKAAAGAPGLSLLQELRLVSLYRGHALAGYASRLLDAGQPRSARAAALMALDAGHGRRIGALNPPLLFAALADADLRLGRSREALDMLAPLKEVHPGILGLQETIGDLVVLEGMTRLGDSKEN
jgi:hypothetical protein